MPHFVDVQKLLDGPSHVVLRVYIVGDGISSELVNYTILNPSTDVVPPMPRRRAFIVKQVWYELGFSLSLGFNSTQPWYFWTLTPTTANEHDWCSFGGIRDNSDPANFGLDSNGNVIITTAGLAATTNRAAFVLKLEKRDQPSLPSPLP